MELFLPIMELWAMSEHEVVIIENAIHEIAVIEKEKELVEIGMMGKQGARGFTYTPVIEQNGVLGWTNDGNLPNPPDFNLSTIVDISVPISNQEILSVVRS